MEKEMNVVTLPLDEYNLLKQIKENVIEGGRILVTYTDNPRYPYNYYYYTQDLAIKEIAKLNEELRRDIDKFWKELQIAKTELVGKKAEIETPIKTMSIWQFIKWRKK